MTSNKQKIWLIKTNWSYEYMKIIMRTAGCRIIWKKIIAVIFFHIIFTLQFSYMIFIIKFITSSSSFHRFIMNQFNDLLSVGTCLLRVLHQYHWGHSRVQIPYWPDFFQAFLFTTTKVASFYNLTAMIFFHIIGKLHR